MEMNPNPKASGTAKELKKKGKVYHRHLECLEDFEWL
jgi:hypothetical protein